jgi:hypothetical protein
MKQIATFMFLLLLSACSPHVNQPVESPDGHYILSAEVSGDEAGPTRRMCVRLRITDQKTKTESVYQTGASDNSKWAVGWLGDVPILFSSDIGIYAYNITGGSITERLANEEEKEAGRKAYERKYGKRPSF